MKKYLFTREFYSTVPGWEIDLYKSGDVNGSWTTWRGCLIAALLDCTDYPEDVLEVMDESTLEEVCLSKLIYCCVEDQ